MPEVPAEAALALARRVRKSGCFAVLGREGPDSGLADLGALLVRGPDAAAFLHGQVTNEVKALQPGAGNLSARVTRTGALVRLFSLHRLPEDAAEHSGGSFMLLLEREGIPVLKADLEQFLLAEDAVLEDFSERLEWLALQGPAAPHAAALACGNGVAETWSALPEFAVRRVAGQDIPPGTWAFARSLTGDAGFLLAVPAQAPGSEAFFRRVGEAARQAGLLCLEGLDLAGTLEILRIEAGVVRPGADYRPEQRVLPETGLEQRTVSYTKGCYLGQEVIARIRTYGSVPSALRGLVFETAGPGWEHGRAVLEQLPASGETLLSASGQKLGELASRTYSPLLEAPIAMAYLGRAHRAPGTQLSIHGRHGALEARVGLLPFYYAPDRKARARFLHEQAIRLFAAHQDAKSVELLEEALGLDPACGDAYEALGVILGRAARFEEAIAIFKRLEELAPAEPMVHTNLSLFYMRLGDKEKAELEKAKAAAKGFGQASNEAEAQARAAAEAVRRRTGAGRKKRMFEEVLALDPEDPLALFGLGNALLALDDLPGAERIFCRACEVQKDNAAVYLAYGKTLEALKRGVEAAGVFRKGIEVASRKGDLMPLKEMEQRLLLLEAARRL